MAKTKIPATTRIMLHIGMTAITRSAYSSPKLAAKLAQAGATQLLTLSLHMAGFNEALDCMAKFGRVALLGCTRNADFTVDYYKKIHGPGITVIGAHTIARPNVESHPGWFTHRDDIQAALRLCAGGRLNLEEMVEETHSPEECAAVYERLAFDRNFPIAVQFDWRKMK